jgi:hypothetical protein
MSSVTRPYEITQATPPEVPPEVPIKLPESAGFLSPPVPVVYEDSPAKVEYRVLARSSLEAAELEAELNALGREGWWLAQILTREKPALLVFVRWARGARSRRAKR